MCRGRASCVGWLAPVLVACVLRPAVAAAQVASNDSADLTLVGRAAEDSDFRRLLSEWNPALEIRQASDLNAADVLSRAATKSQLRIWVVLASAQTARLYFADPAGARFLVREVPLVAGLDESGRETLAQVIATSARAFVNQAVTSSPSEIAASFRPQVAPVVQPSAGAYALSYGAPEPPPPIAGQFWLSGFAVPVDARKAEARPTSWQTHLGAAYFAAWVDGSRLGHGPGVFVAVARPVQAWRWSFAIQGQYRFPLEIRDTDGTIGLHTVSLATWSALERALANDWALGFDIGISIQRNAFSLAPAPSATVMSRSGVSYRPSVPFGLRATYPVGALNAALLLGVDAALVRTHYDIGTRAAFAPWIVQPRFGVEVSL